MVITLPDFFPGEAARIVKLFELGIERVHIRKPGATREQVKTLIEEIPPMYRGSLSLHGHFDLAMEMGVGGINLNSKQSYGDIPEGFVGLVSKSCHSIKELHQANGLDYLLLSPVYPSISKPGYKNNTLLKNFNPEMLPPVIALGGVTPAHFLDLAAKGFGGVAMLGGVWQPVDKKKFTLQYITDDDPEPVLKGGCRWVQLRVKDAPTALISAMADNAFYLCQQYNATFILDDRVDLVKFCNADGVHLGQNDMPVERARQILGPGYIIGATANTFEQVKAAYLAGADYVGVGPFRFTTTKKNLSPVLGIDGYREIMVKCREEGIDIPIVAIGGLYEADFDPLRQVGVDGFAISGAIANSNAPGKKTKELITKINSLKWTN